MAEDKGHTHAVMSKSLAKALMESSVQHFSLGGELTNVLGGQNNYKPPGFQGTQQNYLPELAYANSQQDTALLQQQQLAQALLQGANGQGPNPAQAQLQQNTANNVQTQGAMMNSQRGASSNPALMARQSAMVGAGVQQQASGQAATLQAQQQLAAQQLLAQQQNQMYQQGLSKEGMAQQGFLQQQGTLAGNSGQMAGINAGIGNQNSQNAIAMYGAFMQGAGQATGAASGGGGKGKAQGGEIGEMLQGGNVPGKAKVPGDADANDTVPTMLSPGEIVLPRSVTMSENPEKKAVEFLRHLKKKNGGYGGVLDARSEKKACGGKV